MTTTSFVHPHSIVRQIWGTGDTILFIFAGAAAEFALNKAVDWLYFTGRLPADPLGRLFSTVGYARRIVFSDEAGAHRAIDAMASIHGAVEAQRGRRIPDWAYRDVLFLLIDYSIRSFEVLERPLTTPEKAEVYDVFYRMGSRMGVRDLPGSFADWQRMRQHHLQQDLRYSSYTADLFAKYRQHIGWLRYILLREAQIAVVPPRVRSLLGYRSVSLLTPVLGLYRILRHTVLGRAVKTAILPAAYREEINTLDRVPAYTAVPLEVTHTRTTTRNR
ncbi:oxygenase MpaB family protein [Neolewinella maritima]|nr:oxygenase MpaB family protein [Neolewinella maritima]